MGLSTGTRLGPYEILAPLGAGGMGEVYRARDTRLGRDVALKVVHPRLASDPERLARFEQEARAASQLDHPNILVVHDIGSHEESPYIVSELLDGESLREKLGAPLSSRRAVEYALQVAHGLAAAHEKGIVHRDIKPENLFVTRDGRIKILDFGVAKLTQPAIPAVSLTEAPTAAPSTDAGIVLGTVAYMSPEQVLGKRLDARSDLFSLGVVLYEMLSGKRPFQKDTAPETMTAILREDPPELSGTTSFVPPGLDRIVRHCLEKEPTRRFQTARDLAFDLGSLSETSAPSVTAHVATSLSRKVPQRLLFGAGVAAALALAFLLGRRTTPDGISPGNVSFRRLTFRRGNVLHARLAPDGKTVVYSAAWDDKPAELFSARTDSLESRSLGIKNADILSISSKGELAILVKKDLLSTSVGGGTLARLPLGGGAPREIAEGVISADWSPDGSELAVIWEKASEKSRLEYPIGKTLYEMSGVLSRVSVSPKGDPVAFIEFESAGHAFVGLVDGGGKVRRLSGPWGFIDSLVWRPDGRSVLFGAGATESDAAIREVSLGGRERILYPSAEMLLLHDLQGDGGLLVERELFRFGIVMRSPSEEREREVSWLDASIGPCLSADGLTLVFSEGGEGGGPAGSVFLRKAGAETAVRLGGGWAQGLSPDGKWVLSLVREPHAEFVLLPTGTGAARKIPVPGLAVFGGGFLDGRTLFVTASASDKPVGIWVLPLEGGTPRLVLSEVGNGGIATSPDGKRLAIHVGGGKGFLLPLDGGERTPLKGLEVGDSLIQWSGDERFLFVVRRKEIPAKIVRIEIESGKRELWKELIPADPVGVVRAADGVAVSRDLRSYAYSYPRVISSDLYLLEGVK